MALDSLPSGPAQKGGKAFLFPSLHREISTIELLIEFMEVAKHD